VPPWEPCQPQVFYQKLFPPALLDPALGEPPPEIKGLLLLSWPTQVNSFWAGTAEEGGSDAGADARFCSMDVG